MAAQPSVNFELNVKDNTQRALRQFNNNLRNTARTLAVFQGPLGPVAGRFTAMATALGTLNPLMLATTGGMAALGLAASKAVSEFSRTESQLMQLEAQLENTGYTAGQTSQSLEDLAQGVARETLASLEEVRKAQGILLSFRSIGEDAFDRTLRAAQDLAQAGMGSITSASIALGKALEDPIRNLGALSRGGTTFTSSQKAVIESLVETGNQTEALSTILDAVEAQISGTGAGASGGTAGAFDSLAQSVTNLWSAMGKSITSTSIFKQALSGLDNLAQRYADSFGSLDDITSDNLIKYLDEINQELVRFQGSTKLAKKLFFDEEELKTNKAAIEAILQARGVELELSERLGAAERARAEAREMEARAAEKSQKAMEEQVKAWAKLTRKADPYLKAQTEYLENMALVQKMSGGNAEYQEYWSRKVLETYDKQIEKLQQIDGEATKVVGNIKLFQDVGDAVASSFTTALFEAQKLGDAVKALAADLARMVIQQTVMQGLANAIGAGLTGMFPNANGVPPAQTRSPGSAIGGYRSGATLVGEYGPELVNLPRGSRVSPKLGGGSPNITIINNAPTEVDAQEGPDGGILINIAEAAVNKSLSSRGSVYQGMQATFGSKQRAVTR